MQLRLIGYVLGIAFLIAPLAAMANQSDKYGRVNEIPQSIHEVPAFVCDRVDVVPGHAFHRPPNQAGPSARDAVARGDDFLRGRRDAVCACPTGA